MTAFQNIRTFVAQEDWANIARLYAKLTIGALVGALSVVAFLIPADIVPTGATGVAVMANELIGIPVGLFTILINIPVMVLGYKMLPGGWRMIVRSVFVVVVFSVVVDALVPYFPAEGYVEERFVNALFGGVVSGMAGGFVYRTGANFGGTSTLALILQRKLGTPLSTTTLYTDTAIIVGAAALYGIEGALYALIVLFLGSVAADYVMEGPSVIRTAMIVTNDAHSVADRVRDELGRGATLLFGQGMYTGEARDVLYVTVSRSQTADLERIIQDVDEDAFVVIGVGHRAYGEGFKKPKKKAVPPISS